MIVTQNAGTYDSGGPVNLEIDYDNLLMLVVAFRCIHQGSIDFPAKVARSSDGLIYGTIFPKGQTTVIPMPAAVGVNAVSCVMNATTGKVRGFNLYTGF